MVFPVDSLISQWDKNHQLSGGIKDLTRVWVIFAFSVFQVGFLYVYN